MGTLVVDIVTSCHGYLDGTIGVEKGLSWKIYMLTIAPVFTTFLFG